MRRGARSDRDVAMKTNTGRERTENVITTRSRGGAAPARPSLGEERGGTVPAFVLCRPPPSPRWPWPPKLGCLKNWSDKGVHVPYSARGGGESGEETEERSGDAASTVVAAMPPGDRTHLAVCFIAGSGAVAGAVTEMQPDSAIYTSVVKHSRGALSREGRPSHAGSAGPGRNTRPAPVYESRVPR